jgi:hypothetical protein
VSRFRRIFSTMAETRTNDQTSRIRTCRAGLVAWSPFERLTSSQVFSVRDGILERQR